MATISSGGTPGDDLEIRRSTAADGQAVLDLMAESLGWVPDGQHASFARWKHLENPFGVSPAWVAIDGGQIVGLRTFLRWEFDSAAGPRRAVRAVDTATRTSHRGRGIFRRLTQHAVAELAADGVSLVFNTPNDKSRPGYLAMGWQDLGRLPVRARPRLGPSLVRLAGARVPATRWSEATTAGVPAASALDDAGALRSLLASRPPPTGLRTAHSPAYLQWRYGFAALRYRALLRGRRPEDGMALFRLRRRGPALEAVVADVLVPGDDRQATAGLLRAVARASGADYAVALSAAASRARYLPLPSIGPQLTWRALADSRRPPLSTWQLSMGDVELF